MSPVDQARAAPPQVALSGSAIARRALVAAGIFGSVALLVAARAPLCPFAALTGMPCPGCGLTRSTLSIMRGDLGAAFAMQPFAFVMTPLLAAAVVVVTYNFIRTGRAVFFPRFARVFLPVFGVLFLAMLGLWVARFLGVHGGPVPV